MLVDVLVRRNFIVRFVLTFGRLDLHLDLQRTAVQLGGVADAQMTDGVADGAELLVGNFLGLRIVVAQIETREQLAALILTVCNAEDTFKECTISS